MVCSKDTLPRRMRAFCRNILSVNFPCFFVVVFLSGSFFLSASSEVQAAPNTSQPVTNIQSQSKVLIVGSEQEYPPFATGMTDETAGGFTVDLWKAVAAETGLDYTLRVQPFHQVLNNFKTGKIDLLINLAISDERDQFADFTVPHVIVHGAIFVRKGETSIRSEDDFDGKSIIVLKADLAHDYAIARGWEKQLVTVDTNAEGMQLLASGKHDAMLLGKLTGMQTLQKTGLSNIVALPVKAGFSQKFAFAVPAGESRLLAIINEALALTKANGTYDKLYEQWFGIYEPKEVGWRDVWHYIVPIVVLLFLSAGYFFYHWKIEREASARRYRDLYDNAPTMFLSVEPEKGVVIDCNKTLLDMTGYSREEVVGHPVFGLYHPNCADIAKASFQSFLTNKKVHNVELQLRCLDDRRVDVILNSSAVCDKKGTILYSRSTLHDITEQKQAEERLRESEEKFRTLADTSPLAIYMCSGIEQTAEYVNPTFVKLFGYTIDEVPTVEKWWPLAYPDEDYRNLITNEWQEKVERAIEANSQIEPMEVVVTCKDGSIKNILWGFSAIGKQNWAIGLDLTERKQAESAKENLERTLHQSHKMEAIGTLAGGIAHDFNNLLSIISSNVDVIQSKQHAGNGSDENFEHVKKAVSRGADLIRQILSFSRHGNPELKPVQLSIAVDETLRLIRSTIPSTVEILKTIDDGNFVVNADATQLQQVFINLCTNAVYAMGEKGLLRINLEEADLTADELLSSRNLKAGSYAKLSIGDTGVGINEEIIDRIFDPFFTTKDIGDGTGMGLSLVHGIVKDHGGFISVDSRLGEGTTFNIYFPAFTEIVTEQEAIAPKLLPTGNERILFVDDEECIAYSCNELLKCQGYKVTSVTSSVDALDIFKKRPEEFDLVFTDQTMPEMSGAELAIELLKIRADIPIILCSGYSAMVSEEDAKRMGIREFCMKPMGMEQLANVARRVLDESGKSS